MSNIFLNTILTTTEQPFTPLNSFKSFNKSYSSSKKSKLRDKMSIKTLSLVDINGCEFTHECTFEQLLYNYTNEKL